MQLEILRTHGWGELRPVELLLVHGSFVGAWVWERFFMPYFAAAGFNVHALSLSGHGRSPTRTELKRLTLADYTNDLIKVTSTLDRPVVAIGHSLGGAIVQNAIACGARFAGAVLMASVPPYGLLPANLTMFWSRPALWHELAKILVTGVRFADAEILRDGLFANRIDAGSFADFAERIGDRWPSWSSLGRAASRPYHGKLSRCW